MTTVIHIKNTPKGWKENPEFVYIGRAGKGEIGTFGNPFRLYDEDEREACLERYRKWFFETIERDAEFKQKVLELKDKILVCFCREIDTPALETVCHGDILADYVNGSR